jgi:acyl-CoA dehydrogenase
VDFDYSNRCKEWLGRLKDFMTEHIYPAELDINAASIEADRWQVSPRFEDLKSRARVAGLWNMFLPNDRFGAGLSNLEYAPLAEEMGRVPWASEIFNCSAPDTGNMEVLSHYGSHEQQERWLRPLLEGAIRSAYVMTEPEVASSDATNIALEIRREGDCYVLNGRKWWITGLGHPRCDLLVVMGRTGGSDRHRQHSTVLVPREASGITVVRTLSNFGYDDAPHGHCEVRFDDVRVSIENIVLGEGRGFEIAQGRLGPGRIHHCMRSIGAAERALELLCARIKSRSAFGRLISEQGVWRERIAKARCRIDMARLLTLKAAAMMDSVGNKGARKEIAMIKIVAPSMACQVIDWAIQAHGGAGLCRDFGLAESFAIQRSLRIADGPDEVHREAVAKLELKG